MDTAIMAKGLSFGSDEKLSAFLELERITHEIAVSALLGDRSETAGSALKLPVSSRCSS
jgi:hypothetical protein